MFDREQKSRLYLHKNSEKQNSDANLQSQFTHVFPAVRRRHVHDSEIIRQVKNVTNEVSSEGCCSLYNPPLTKRALPGAELLNHTHRAHPSRLGHLKQPPRLRLSPAGLPLFRLFQAPRAIFLLLQLCCCQRLLYLHRAKVSFIRSHQSLQLGRGQKTWENIRGAGELWGWKWWETVK